jgi:hypothetical protein
MENSAVMSVGMSGSDKTEVIEMDISQAVKIRRDEIFRSGWKNTRQLSPLVSRAEDSKFHFLVEWCEEFDNVISHHRERLSDPDPRIKES